MSNMTTLHFASPFAVSATVPQNRFSILPPGKAILDAQTSASRQDQASATETAARTGADAVSALAADEPPDPAQAGSATSFHDVVMRRYHEFDGVQASATPKTLAAAESEALTPLA